MKKIIVLGFCACMVAGVVCGGTHGRENTSTLDSPHLPATATPPLIDGRLDDACWQADACLLAEAVSASGGEYDALATIIRICRDDSWLYVAFDCANPAMAQLRARASERDSIFTGQDESVEVHVVTPGIADGHRCFGVNFVNVQTDALLIQSPWKNMDWNAIWRSAVQMRTNGWSAELAIPLFCIAPEGMYFKDVASAA